MLAPELDQGILPTRTEKDYQASLFPKQRLMEQKFPKLAGLSFATKKTYSI